MATLERRVQVLFDEELYERLLAEATAERMSVGAYIRLSVEGQLDRRRSEALAALKRLWASADANPQPDEDWESIKEDHLDRPVLMDIE